MSSSGKNDGNWEADKENRAMAATISLIVMMSIHYKGLKDY